MKAVAGTNIVENPVMAHHAAGHRQRLRDRFLSAEESVLTEEGLLELLLTFAIPQKDVRPLAVALLERFGSLQAVLSAVPDSLRQVTGIGDAVVVLLKLVGYVVQKHSLPAKIAKIRKSNHLQHALFPSESADSQTTQPLTVPLDVPHVKQRPQRSRTGLFGKGLMKETLELLPQLPATESMEEVRTFLRGALHFNSTSTRQRYASYITARMFPQGVVDKALCGFARQYARTQALRDVCFYRFLQVEPLIGEFLQERVIPALGRGVLARSTIRQFLEEHFPETKRSTIQSTASAIIEVLTAAGLVRLEKTKLTFQSREVCLEALAFILHSEFPFSGMYDIGKIEANPTFEALLWRSDRILPALYELRNRGLIAKVSEIDSVRQFTTRYTLDELVHHLLNSQGGMA